MVYFFKKIAHFLTANSRHGTHSPFVYALADQLIYNKRIDRSDSLITDIIRYYNDIGITDELFLVTDFCEFSIDELSDLQGQYFMIFIKNIHAAGNLKKWNAMQSDERFIVLIDLFEFGIVCKRKEQPKETFKLRYPYHFY